MNFGKKRLLVVGHLAKDIVETRSGKSTFWGGGGFHVALAAALYLPEKTVILKSKAGKDFDFSTLVKAGVDVSQIEVDRERETDRHWLNETGETRTYQAEDSLSNEISLKELPLSKSDIGWIHLSSTRPEQHQKWLEEIKELGWDEIPRSCDTFETFVRENPKAIREIMNICDLGFANEEEWNGLKAKDIQTDMIVKKGECGADYISKNNDCWSVDAEKGVKLKDTTGAGDVVAGVYLAMLLLGKSKSEALTEACRVATMSIDDFGTAHLIGRVGFSNNFAIETNRN